MKRIESFTVDHSKLLRGLYVSRKDIVGVETVTTFDIRMKEPNREPVIDIAALHTIEHLGATFLRNHEIWAEKTIYFGPMGCCTGFYIIFKGDLKVEDVVLVIKEMFGFIAIYEGKIPGASSIECGNHSCQDLAAARLEAKKYLNQVVEKLTCNNILYPGQE